MFVGLFEISGHVSLSENSSLVPLAIFFEFNNFILRWYCAIAEANQNQPLITINMVKKFFFYLRHVGADTKITSMWQPYTDMSIPH